jgi:hypothetical protein
VSDTREQLLYQPNRNCLHSPLNAGERSAVKDDFHEVIFLGIGRHSDRVCAESASHESGHGTVYGSAVQGLKLNIGARCG